MANRDGLVGEELILAAGEHASGKAMHDGLCLDMKVSKHFVASPAAE